MTVSNKVVYKTDPLCTVSIQVVMEGGVLQTAHIRGSGYEMPIVRVNLQDFLREAAALRDKLIADGVITA
jgi:hypothetical protein